MRFVISILVLVAILLSGLFLWSRTDSGPLKVSGFVESDEIRVGSRLGGRVKAVKVVEGQHVKRGELLVELEPFDLIENREQASAVVNQRSAEYTKRKSGLRPEEIAQAVAKVDQLKANLQKAENGPRAEEIAAAKAELQLAEAELKLAEQLFQRAESLRGRQAISTEEFDRATNERAAAKSRLQVRTESLKLLQAGTRPEEIAAAKAQVREAQAAADLAKNGYRSEDVAEAHSAMDAARAAYSAIEKQVAELSIVSPSDATVEAIDLQPGDLVSPNAPAASLIDRETLWVRAYVPENRLAVQIGQKVAVTVDSFPNRKFAGEVTYIARQAEFTPGNVQTPEERSKQVFRIKVTLRDGLDVLRPGMAADVWLEPAS